jgi:uncharacterized protein (TIGR02996 family)
MPHADPFLAAILAEPDDDLPRLIYADWLDERGDPDRAEFIRTQIELARLPVRDPRRRPLAAREAELLDAHGPDWLDPPEDFLANWYFVRGFPEVGLSVRAFLRHADGLARIPDVTRVHLHAHVQMHDEDVRALADFPAAIRVDSLYLGFEWVRDVGAMMLAESPHLGRLAALNLQANGLTAAGAAALAASPKLPRLRELQLVNNLIDDAGAEALAASPERSGLVRLDLSHNEIGPAGALALAESPHLTGLKHLRFAGNGIDGRTRAGRALRRRFGRGVVFR